MLILTELHLSIDNEPTIMYVSFIICVTVLHNHESIRNFRQKKLTYQLNIFLHKKI